MHDDDTGPTPTREKETQAISAMLYLAIVVGTITTALLAGGLGMMGATGYKIGPYAGYGGGLMMVGSSITLTVAIGALLCHRVNLRDNARTRAEVRKLRIEVHQWRTETCCQLGILRDEVAAARRDNRHDHNALLTGEKHLSETLTDQLAQRRNGY